MNINAIANITLLSLSHGAKYKFQSEAEKMAFDNLVVNLVTNRRLDKDMLYRILVVKLAELGQTRKECPYMVESLEFTDDAFKADFEHAITMIDRLTNEM